MLVGVDMGTSSTRVVVLDEDGRSLAVACRPTQLFNPSRQVFEQDPEQMYTSVLLAINDVLSAGDLHVADIVGIAMCGQMAGISTIGRIGKR